MSDFGGIERYPSEFVESIEGCQCERNEAIKVVFLHSLRRLIVNDSDLRFHSDLTRAVGCTIVCSFTAAFKPLLGEPVSKIWEQSQF
jgi:hypothetical protein